ncbi:intermembrane lipid transfer protein Vps13D isoform X2 [Anthonomus grandis grandis]|uniref:intermembrane lipid transfer protein Vps13D isoform X2 n=1 Tax=Anthonomus grandis grandis TaxID=2921223 RepID=UPI00216531A6|nr:intermembrane lipid transfer protein Vps13D isoform X2 [Anthonomus grandis grandis]
MLEGLATWVLNNYLGKYVQLNTDQLSIALLSGQVELENVPLKTDALSQLGLPIRIRSGFIGKVKLQIPVRQIRSAPWVISFEQLYVVASLLPLEEWDHDSEQSIQHDVKITALDNLEAKWRMEKDLKDSNYYASSYFSWYSYSTGFVSEILENIQLKIKNVHIRYEDSFSVPGQTVAFGITIDSLTAQSCDSNWTPGQTQSSQGTHSFKLLELEEFALYWMKINPEESYVGLGVSQLADLMSTSKSKNKIRDYIIPSVSAQAHLKRNKSTQPLRSSSTPRIICDLLLEEVPLKLVDWQYNQIVACTKGLENISRLRGYRRYKPCSSVKEDSRAWWYYAISCFYPGGQPALCRPRPTWERSLEMARQNVKYVQVYKKLLITPAVALTAEEKKIKDQVEWDREYEDLRALREVAMNSVTLPTNNTSQSPSRGRSMLESWFPQWMGWYSTSSAESPESGQLEGEILQVLADTAENNTVFKRDAVFGQFTFCLKNGTLSLCTLDKEIEESSPMIELEFKNLLLTLSSKPRSSSHTIELSLDALYLKDRITKDTLFPILVGPPGHDRTSIALRGRPYGGPSPRNLSFTKIDEAEQQLFYLVYEKKPPHSGCDYRLNVKTKCLDVVYQPNAVKWLTNFLCFPHQRNITQSRIEAMKSKTKKEIFKNWEQLLEGRVVTRSSWELELDISAPQIIFVENFTDQNSAMAVIDFGRLQLKNNISSNEPPAKPEFIAKESEEDETFLTPCSTPPVSENSDESDERTLDQTSQIDELPEFKLDETNFHNKLYDCYSLDLSDLQILIGKAKENWRYALNKGSSTLHVIDRFNISLQIERRVIYTNDPLYPSLTLNANLPKLVVHLNENKICSARNLLQLILSTGLPSPIGAHDGLEQDTVDGGQDNEDSVSMDTSVAMCRLLMMQFTIDQLSLELQSRGRAVAELQVASVKVAFTKRAVDTSITLTVHSLLLVDALQTFGPDFELLVASHKHVGMDSMSGSIRDSEPTSPTSPDSPDPNIIRQGATSPMALTQALSTLSSDPPKWPGALRDGVFMDSEALITIEICLVSGSEPVQIANVQFNNLDIIANQETIVELVGFVRRVFPKSQRPSGFSLPTVAPSSIRESTESLVEGPKATIAGSTELTFDFHRLNVLLLRGVVRDGMLYGKKICTATMSEAKIHATVHEKLVVEGSLGGLQVLDLTPEGHMHQRIISVGQDPLLEMPHPLYMMTGTQENDTKAFSFKVVRNLQNFARDKDTADVTIRMASLWYTHSPLFVVELQSCATEFKQYLANLARSIRTAATDMALGLVHARAEALAQSLNMNKRLSSSIYGSALSISESASPGRRRRKSSSCEASGYTSARETISQTPYSPEEDDAFTIDVNLDIELDSPVLVLPRSSASSEVFVAHLGKIRISNSYNSTQDTHLNNGYSFGYDEFRTEHYDIEVRDMNIFSLNTKSRRVPGPMISRPEVLYSCKSQAKPILHDTMLQLDVVREIPIMGVLKSDSDSMLFEDEEEQDDSVKPLEKMEVTGKIVTALKVSLTRAQYEQVLDTMQWLTSSPVLHDLHYVTGTNVRPQNPLGDISEEDTGVTTLNMDPHVRAKLFSPTLQSAQNKSSGNVPQLKVSMKLSFEIPVFTIELRGEGPSNSEQGLVDLSFRDFVFSYEKCHKFETNIQVSLRSIFMEDLLLPEGSRQRSMVISSNNPEPPPNTSCVSRSCPDITYHNHMASLSNGSLPDHLETANVFGVGHFRHQLANGIEQHSKPLYPCTPPPSPTQGSGRPRPERNLVLITTLLVDPSAPNFDTKYHSTQRSTSVDFNCLDLVISVPSWAAVIDFFSGNVGTSKTGSTLNLNSGGDEAKVRNGNKKTKVATNITVCSLTVVLVKPDRDIAKANISNVEVTVKIEGLQKEVKGILGSMSLLDLTLHGQIYKERFLTSGKEALQFKYIRHPPDGKKDYDTQLTLDMASVMYVHTKRFVAELQAFFNKFVERQETVLKGLQAATSGKLVSSEPLRLSLILKAKSPIILLPLSSKSSSLVIIDLGKLLVTNKFRFSGEEGTISTLADPETQKKCLLEVMQIELENMDLYTGVKDSELTPTKSNDSFKFGSCLIMRKGPSLLTKKFELKLQYERNLHKDFCHIVPDSSIYGHLSTLDCALDIHQYKLIRGLLIYNLGEDTERIYPSVSTGRAPVETEHQEEWILSSIKLDMQNVSLRLVKSHSYHSPLTCINFIKSHLTVETFSNLSQDVDLVSQEILVVDTRFHGLETEQMQVKCNVFTNILQPIKNLTDSKDLVQAEIHSRRRQDHTKVTILLNNMRLMAIFDWWEAVREYIFQEIDNVQASPERQAVGRTRSHSPNAMFELKLNVTDSELVLVENSSQWDSNAVILKSTTVVTYRPNQEKPLSCSLNNCEMFSCILGEENETALSIIDPVTLNIDLVSNGLLEVQMQFLTVRLSYHDMCMFRQMLDSLPKQMLSGKDAQSTPNYKNQIQTLTALGFQKEDCIRALELCDNKLDDAAIWLTQNAENIGECKDKTLNVHTVEVRANCISICIIDDCGDSDVPLLEVSLSDLELSQMISVLDLNLSSRAYLQCSLAGNYYNRVLSGWEPILEPWMCKVMWEKSPSQNLINNRLMVKVESEHTFNINITSTLMTLFKQVKENWTSDLLRNSALKRRSPFVPFALKNNTGTSLKFTTHISDWNMPNKSVEKHEGWWEAQPGETVPFSFTTRDKLRHQNSHKLRMHQLGVKIEGWQPLDAVTVDKVGTYFRDTPSEAQNRYSDILPARVVFDIALEGSARKLVTIRSALMIINNLPEIIEVKLESRLPHDNVTFWVPCTTFTIDPKESLAVPLIHTHSQIHVRPKGLSHQYTYSSTAMTWDQMQNNVDRMFILGTCHTHKGHNYRFCAEIIKEKVLIERSTRVEQPAHRIFLHPTVKIVNLLPVDMQYIISKEKGVIKAGQNAALTSINPDETVDLEIRIDNFKTCTNIIIPYGTSEFSCRIKLEDSKQRKLYLTAEILVNRHAKLKINIFAPYWIVNKTGLPLVFKQSGTSTEAAGQFDEHEQARMVSPMLFSFSDQDASSTINARVGRRVVWDGTPQWCSNFHARKGTQHRKLHVTIRDKSDRVFIVGIEVRQGRGKYRGTHIISISPRYQLHNRSSYKLVFAQSYLVKENNGETPSNQKSFLKALPNSYTPFHWSSLDKPQLLCVSIEDIPDCCWSGGFKIDSNNSMHINIRDPNSRVYFLRLEVVLQSATFYIIFTDADTMPPPIRIDNFSEVPIKFGQSCFIDVMHSTARAHSSVPYAWDEPTKKPLIKLVAPGGVSKLCDVNNLGLVGELTYENFIYIAFVGTFKNAHRVKDPHDVECQELVLDVGKKNKVFLARKIPSQRSQLWRMTLEGYLVHEGSCPPSHPNAQRSQENLLVLDIADTAPQPNYYSRLTLRRIDPRRRSTQRWRFTENGRLCCDHHNMCVQAEDGFYGLREGSLAVLGLPQPTCHKLTDKGVPIEQAVEFQRLRPGSGTLRIEINMDGPTQVITIKDVQETRTYALPDDREWGTISQRPRLVVNDVNSNNEADELQFNLDIKGLGISVVSRKAPEELLYAYFSNIIAETIFTSEYKQFCVSVKDMQIDNQLLDATVPVVLYVTPPKATDEATDFLPAIDLKSEIQPQTNENAVIFKHLILRLKKITAIIEERLLLKVLAFIGFHSKEEEVLYKDETDYETQRLLTEVSASTSKRYYFGVLKLIPDEIRLSVRTATKLSKQLQRIKKKLGLTLIKFEDAAILLEPFDRKHPFETSQFLIKSIVKHFKDELRWQAGVILGSIDFIGNPLGLMNDVSEGISGFIFEGNVGALVKNVTHGLSNSAAKVTESLSDGLGKIAMDDYHEEMRMKIRQVETGKSSDHILAGIKGLGFGFLGGATGIFKQVYEGASNDGISGVFSGFGKGVVGAFTKPVVGVLDFASETARAVRDSSRSKLIPERKRLPRCVHGPAGLLPKYDGKQSQGQQFLFMVNDKRYEEKLLAYQILGNASEDLLCIVSDRMIRIVTTVKFPELTTVIECSLSDLESCNVIKEKESGESRYYIEIVMHYSGPNAILVNADPIKRPRVRCRTAELALTTAQQINYAKSLYVEQLYTLTSDENVTISED